MKLLHFFLIMVLLIISYALYSVQTIVQHEYLHQLIYEKYGFDTNVTYNFWGAAKHQIMDCFKLNILENSDIDNMEAWAWVTVIEPTSGPADLDSNTSTAPKPKPICTETCRMLNLQLEISDNQTNNMSSLLFMILLLAVLVLHIIFPTPTPTPQHLNATGYIEQEQEVEYNE